MSSVSLNRKRVKLKQLIGIRARLALLAVILVAPLMLERARSLEDNRARLLAQASQDFANLARHSADTQREVISSVQTVLKSAAYIRSSAGGLMRTCDILRASVPANMPWIRNILLVGGDGRVQCSTGNTYVGLYLGDRPYLKKAQPTRDFVVSDFLMARGGNNPVVMAAYPVSAINPDSDAVMLASMSLDWMSKLMSNLGGRPGISAVLIDSNGTVLATPPDTASQVGKSIDDIPLLSAMADRALTSDKDEGSLTFGAVDGSRRTVSFARIADTGTRLLVSIDEDKITAAIKSEIRTAYLQLAFVCLFVLIGALIAAEKLVIKPIEMLADMATRFGQGDRSARAARTRLPAEFVPLARAFNAMAAQLAQRERELVATNDRLTVIASIDMLSGLANRRGFQSRLDFEWMKAQQYDCDAVAADDRCRSLQALQRHLWSSRGRRLPDAARRDAVRDRRRHHGLCRPLRRRGVLPAVAECRWSSAPRRSARRCARPCRRWTCRTGPRVTRSSPSASASPARARTTRNGRAT